MIGDIPHWEGLPMVVLTLRKKVHNNMANKHKYTEITES